MEMFNTARSLGLSLDEKAYMNLISYYGKAGIVLNTSPFTKQNKKLLHLYSYVVGFTMLALFMLTKNFYDCVKHFCIRYLALLEGLYS